MPQAKSPKQEVYFNHLAVRRVEDRLHIQCVNTRCGDLIARPCLVVRLTDGGLELDPHWQEEQDYVHAHSRAWQELLKGLGFRGELLARLEAACPPRCVSSPSEMRKFLSAIAWGEVPIEGLRAYDRDVIGLVLRLS